MKTTSPFRCVGVWGRLFGHRFHTAGAFSDTVGDTNFCTRCGMPSGGWR